MVMTSSSFFGGERDGLFVFVCAMVELVFESFFEKFDNCFIIVNDMSFV